MKKLLDLSAEFEKIWSSENIEELLKTNNDKQLISEILKRRYLYFDDVLRSNIKILIVGFNPSCRDKDDKPLDTPFIPFSKIINECRNRSIYPTKKWDTYWSRISEMLADSCTNLHDITAYWDLFSFREKTQSNFKKHILTEEPSKFIIGHIQLAQRIIEIVKPQLIIVKNKEAWAYFGKYFSKLYCDKETGLRWMNYMFSPIEEFPCAETEVRRITGIHQGNVSGLSNTELIGTKVLFMKHINQYTKKEDMPTPQLLSRLLK